MKNGIHVGEFARDGWREVLVTATAARPGDDLPVFRRAVEAALHGGARIVHQDLHGCLPARAAAWLDEIPPDDPWPVTVWPSAGGEAPLPAATQIWAAAGCPLQRLSLDGRTVGSLFEAAGVRYARLGGLTGSGPSRPEQVRSLYGAGLEALRRHGFGFSHVARTWFCLDDILGWYGDFNRERDNFLAREGIAVADCPASTGVGGASGSAVVAGLLAVSAAHGGALARPAPSPLQSEPSNYGVIFSRAKEIRAGGVRRLLVSGTASIDAEGRTVCAGHTAGQVERTADVVESCLGANGMSWANVTRGVAFIPRTGDEKAWASYSRRAGIDGLPVAVARNTLCRRDLLFEIEVDAVAEERE